jgi:GTP-binding protein
MFIDKANIFLEAGRGGDGCISFRREKYVPYGGPDGGNGGIGGSIYFKGDSQKITLLDLFYKPKFRAENGQKGSSGNKFGKYGKDLVIKIPLGTVIFKNGEFFADLNSENEKILVVRGGRGGRGNASFKTAKYTAPRIAERGELGEAAKVNLELRLIADIGIVGLPNAGKSTLLSKISNANPKIANYPFTTLFPNLGVVNYNGKKFVVVDIPGIINGAHKGKGLGIKFLRHVKRAKALVHVVDTSGFCGNNNPYESYKIVSCELKKYSNYVIKKRVIVVLNKIDLQDSPKKNKNFREHFRNKKIFEISATVGTGISALLEEMVKIVGRSTHLISVEEEKRAMFLKKYVYKPEFEVNVEDGVFVVKGSKIKVLTEMTRFDENDALRRYKNILKKMGLETSLKKMGIQFGDTVKIGDFKFVFGKQI